MEGLMDSSAFLFLSLTSTLYLDEKDFGRYSKYRSDDDVAMSVRTAGLKRSGVRQTHLA
jgi:hypothetical protein